MEATMPLTANDESLDIARIARIFRILGNEKAPGQRVPYRDAKQCIAMWSYKMVEHGVGRDAPFAVNIHQRMDITNYVIFGGAGLLEWLDDLITKNKEAADKDELEIHIAYGIYTLPYVNTHIPMAERPHSFNRMSVFLIPVHKTSKEILTDDDDEVFNLGGLQP